MQRTPWAKGSLPSDRIRPSHSKQTGTSKSQNKSKDKAKEAPKSKAVRALESIANAVRNSSGAEKDPKGGCFCQGMPRDHALSLYTPICRECGLVLCSINMPHFACPHCHSPLLDSEMRISLISRLEDEISGQINKEEEERELAAEEARRAEGAFPTLSGGKPGNHTSNASTTSSGASHPKNQTHKVLSLNSTTKTATLSFYAPPSASSRSNSRLEEIEDEPTRIPAPQVQVPYKVDPNRPWKNSRANDIRYIPPPKQRDEDAIEGTTSRSRRKGKKKEATEPDKSAPGTSQEAAGPSETSQKNN